MKSNILFYTFPTWHATSFKMARYLQDEGYKVVYLGNLKTLLNHLKCGEYKHIIGMGKYRKNALNIRQETLFQNKFKSGRIIEGGVENYQTNWILPDLGRVVISKTLTHGPCNRSGYLVLDTISKNNLDSKFAFLHIPSSYNFDQAKLILEIWFSNL